MLQTAMVPMFEASDEHVFTDAQLPALIVRGENWALSGIYGPFAGLVSSIALKILNDRSGSEEIVQQVFTKVWRHARDAQGTLEQVSTRKALQHIPSQERIVIELASWGRMTHREVAVVPSFSAWHRQD